jgi:hypothetical protein
VPPTAAVKSRRAGDGAVVDVIDRVFSQRKNFGQPTADLVDEQHHAERGIAIEASLPRGGDRHRIKIVVAKLAGSAAFCGVVAEVRAVGIPLADRRGIRGDRLFNGTRSGGTKAVAAAAAGGRRRAERLPPQHRGGIGPVCQRRHTTPDAVEMELLQPVERRLTDARGSRLVRQEKVDAIPGKAHRLVLGPRQQDGRAGRGFPGR